MLHRLAPLLSTSPCSSVHAGMAVCAYCAHPLSDLIGPTKLSAKEPPRPPPHLSPGPVHAGPPGARRL